MPPLEWEKANARERARIQPDPLFPPEDVIRPNSEHHGTGELYPTFADEWRDRQLAKQLAKLPERVFERLPAHTRKWVYQMGVTRKKRWRTYKNGQKFFY